jgi:HSP20 family molecular chaperone IbpA
VPIRNGFFNTRLRRAKGERMQEQDINKPQSNEPLVMIRTQGLSPEAKELFDSVARRAYEIFESKGSIIGSDLENWFQAEAELFERAPFQLAESGDEVCVLAEVRNYSPRELEVDLEPRRITIIGRRGNGSEKKTNGGIISKKSGLLMSLQLPVEIDPHHATAHLKRGILELDVKKAKPIRTSTSPVAHAA